MTREERIKLLHLATLIDGGCSVCAENFVLNLKSNFTEHTTWDDEWEEVKAERARILKDERERAEVMRARHEAARKAELEIEARREAEQQARMFAMLTPEQQERALELAANPEEYSEERHADLRARVGGCVAGSATWWDVIDHFSVGS